VRSEVRTLSIASNRGTYRLPVVESQNSNRRIAVAVLACILRWEMGGPPIGGA